MLIFTYEARLALYLVFEWADVIWETDCVLFQLVDPGLLGVDGGAEFVDKSLQTA